MLLFQESSDVFHCSLLVFHLALPNQIIISTITMWLLEWKRCSLFCCCVSTGLFGKNSITFLVTGIGVVGKLLLRETGTSCWNSGVKAQLGCSAGYLEMGTLGGGRPWLQGLDPCHPGGDVARVPALPLLGIGGVNQLMAELCHSAVQIQIDSL